MSKKNIISALLFLYCLFLPYEEVLVTPVGSLLKIIGLIIMFVIMLFTRQYEIQKNWVLIIIWLVINALSVLWADSFSWWSYFFGIYVSQVVFVLLVAHIPPQWVDFNVVKWGLVIGASIASIILVFFPHTSTYTSEGRRTLMILDAHMDPNILAMIILMAIFLLLSMEVHKVWYLIIILLITGIFYTGSRGVTIAMIFSFAMMIFRILKDKKRKIQGIFTILIVFLAMCIIWNVLPDDLLSSRFSVDTILGINEFDLGSHNRYTIWLHSWELFVEKPILGYGCGNFFSAIKTVYRECAAHNLIVLEVVEIGIIGSVPLFCFLYDILRKTYATKQMYIFYMLIAVYIVALTLDTLSNKYFWLAFIFANWVIRENKRNVRND